MAQKFGGPWTAEKGPVGDSPGVRTGLSALSGGALEGLQEAKRQPEGSPTDLRMKFEGVLKRGRQDLDSCNISKLISPMLALVEPSK